jgi:acyl carrier protein
MTGDELRRVILRVLGEIAPEADLSGLKPDVSLRDQLDLDSMDVLNFVIGLHETLRVDIPEADYPQLLTVNGAMQYLAAALDSTSSSS